MILEVEPLADAESRSELAKNIERQFGRTVLAQDPHVEMPVIRRAFRLLVACRRRPGAGQVVEAVPVNPWAATAQQFRRAFQAPGLNFLRSEAGDAYFRDPHGQRGRGPYLVELGWPIAQPPQIPGQRETVDG